MWKIKLKKQRFLGFKKNDQHSATACAFVSEIVTDCWHHFSSMQSYFFFFLMWPFHFVHTQPIPKSDSGRVSVGVGWRLAGRVLCRADCAVHFTSQVGWKTQGTGPWACTKSPHLGATSTGLSAPLSSRFGSSSPRQAQPSTDPACHDTLGWFYSCCHPTNIQYHQSLNVCYINHFWSQVQIFFWLQYINIKCLFLLY